jgi:glycerate 2-kinase
LDNLAARRRRTSIVALRGRHGKDRHIPVRLGCRRPSRRRRGEEDTVRVVVAPDKFAGTMTAPQAARAIADGWRRRSPDDDLEMVPMADGGPGFLDVLHAALGGSPCTVQVPDPYGELVETWYLLHEGTAYVEAAQACGLHLSPVERRDPERGSSRGVGELVATALDEGVRRVVVGLGGTGTNDAGAGFLAALGATSEPDDALRGGPRTLEAVRRVDLAPARERVRGVELVAASDVDNPLLGLIGATSTYGPQKGLDEDRVMWVEGVLERFAVAADRRTSLTPGAGAAGGLGYALLLLGAHRVPGVELVADVVGLGAAVAGADLVVTGEGAFDFSSRSGKVPYGVAAVAGRAARPCIALAGRVLVGSREMRALGVESAYGMVDLVGEERSMSDPEGALADLAERVARTWSRS